MYAQMVKSEGKAPEEMGNPITAMAVAATSTRTRARLRESQPSSGSGSLTYPF